MALQPRKPLRIGIVGTRRRDSPADLDAVAQALERLYRPGDCLISGGCKRGADRFAEILADCIPAPIRIHLPDDCSKLDSELLKRAPRVAYAKINYARNILIARDSDELIACIAPDRRGGTEHTIRVWQRLHPDRKPILV